MLKGIQFVTNVAGEKTAVLIDLNNTANCGKIFTMLSLLANEPMNHASPWSQFGKH